MHVESLLHHHISCLNPGCGFLVHHARLSQSVCVAHLTVALATPDTDNETVIALHPASALVALAAARNHLPAAVQASRRRR